jgi:hypothetical protein
MSAALRLAPLTRRTLLATLVPLHADDEAELRWIFSPLSAPAPLGEQWDALMARAHFGGGGLVRCADPTSESALDAAWRRAQITRRLRRLTPETRALLSAAYAEHEASAALVEAFGLWTGAAAATLGSHRDLGAWFGCASDDAIDALARRALLALRAAWSAYARTGRATAGSVGQ